MDLLWFIGTLSILQFGRTSADMDIKLKPEAEKLTISIDSVAARIPPQIAYYIPDQTFLNGINRNLPNQPNQPNQPPLINMWPPNNQNNRSFTMNVTDLMMSSQRPHRYVAVPKEQVQIDDDSSMAYQNFNYQIDFTKIPDKKPDFKRFEQLYKERMKSSGKSSNKKKKSNNKRPVSSEPLYNYANNSPNIRKRIKLIKEQHQNKFEILKDEQESMSNGNSDEYDSGMSSDRFNEKFRKTHFKEIQRKKPRKYVVTKLSQPTSTSVENESNQFYYDDANNGESNEDYHTNHKNCDHHHHHQHQQQQHSNLVEQQQQTSDDNSNDYDMSAPVKHKPHKIIKIPRKGYAIYLSKVTDTPQRFDRNKAIKFIPTRMLSSVRGTEILVKKPRKFQKPRKRGKISESGAHMVYTEDGYEDAKYHHGSQNRDQEYLKRERRAINYDQLRGQELIDHLDDLIRNVSDYLNSSEIIPNTNNKYPLYNTTHEELQESPIRYSEYGRPVVNDEYSSELYASKTQNCDEDSEDEIDFSNLGNETNHPKKRLRNLGNKLKCLKEKLFGSEPLDNPLFNEETINEPEAKHVLGSAINAAENIHSISSVYTDVMDNIKQNSHNENQRVFSDYGITDNYALGTIDTDRRPSNELNTNEKFAEKPQRYRVPTFEPDFDITESSLTAFNPFNNPAQVPILDISKFIPTPQYQSPNSYGETDFHPIVSPYANDYYQIQTNPPTIRTTTTTTTTPPPPPPTTQPTQRTTQPTRRFHYERLNNNNNNNVNTNHIPPSYNPQFTQRVNAHVNQRVVTNQQHQVSISPHVTQSLRPNLNPNLRQTVILNGNQNAQVYTSTPNAYANQNPISRAQIQNVKFIRRRLPVAHLVRVIPKTV